MKCLVWLVSLMLLPVLVQSYPSKEREMVRLIRSLVKRAQSKDGGQTAQDLDCNSCDCNPCSNGARCSTAEKPLEGLGIDFYCICKGNYGGFFCQIEDPCGGPNYTKCPNGGVDTALCYKTNIQEDGKFCFNKDWELQNTLTDLKY